MTESNGTQSKNSMFGIPIFPGMVPYESEWLHNKATLRNAEWLIGHIKDIVQTDLSYSCKKMLVNRALVLFSPSTLLSNLTPVMQRSGLFGMNVQMVGYSDKSAETDFEEMVLTDYVMCRRSDRSNPNLARIENIQRLEFKLMLTRTKGPNREGLEQHHMTLKNESIMNQSFNGQNPYAAPGQQPVQEKKKWFGLF